MAEEMPADGACESQTVPFEVSTFPDVPGEVNPVPPCAAVIAVATLLMVTLVSVKFPTLVVVFPK
jgi:hypothetical protein